MSPQETLPQWFVHTARKYGDRKVAMRQKKFGIWQEYTWAESYEHVRNVCLGLVELGLTRGEKVAIIGDNDPQYYWAELAIQAAGGVAVGIFTDSTPPEVQYIVDHSDAVIVFAKDQEQVDKMLAIRRQVPRVRRVIYWEEKGLWHYRDPWLLSFEALEELGRWRAEREPDLFERLVAEGRSDDLAILCYTSGTTSLPKGAMIAHRNLIWAHDSFRQVDPRSDNEDYVSFLPLAWITEHVLGIANHVIDGMIVNFPEAPETVQDNIREIAPRVLLFNSRLWENLVALVQVKMAETTRLNRWLYRLFLPVGYRVAEMRLAGQRVPLLWRFLYRLGDLAVFSPLRDKLGLSRVVSAYTAGAALSPDVIRFFRAIGVSIKQLYGSTEMQAVTAHREDDFKFESVGRPLPGVEVRISEKGEILVRSGGVFKGYYKNPEATAEALDEEGWFHTGDAGYIDEDGHLIYLDRLKEMLELADGSKYSPQFIEGRLKFSPYIRDVMVVGGKDRHYLTAIITIDFENVGHWAEQRGIPYTTYVDLSQKPEVYDLIRADVERVNRSLPETARIRAFAILHKEFDPDEAELTRTRKLRRRFMAERYRDIIEAMYDGRPAVRVQAEVKYRDGRTGMVETTVRICRLDGTEEPTVSRPPAREKERV